jgi:uncharacterized iron-regulated membrane protein
LTLGILFPLVGVSLIALLVFDFAILRGVLPLARAFGAVERISVDLPGQA